MPDNNGLHTKKVRKKAEDPFEAAGYELVQIRFQIEKMVKSFSEADRKNPNYKQFIKDILSEVNKAIDPKAREEHKPRGYWQKIYDFAVMVFENKLFLAIICIILGAVLGNIEILKAIVHLIKG
jgi:hypothetical protein